MNNYLDLLKTLYFKDKMCYNVEIGECIALTKTLSKDLDNLDAIKKCLPFIFYINPNHYFYLLYYNIPKKKYLPKFIKLEKSEDELEKIDEKILYVTNWSSKEYKLNKKILFRIINEEKLKMELAIK